MIIIGVDPDKVKSGVAEYVDGELVALHNMTLLQFYFFAENLPKATFHIEDGSLIDTFYAKYRNKPIGVQMKIARSVGANNMQGINLIGIAKHFGHNVVGHKPCAGNWESEKRTAKKNSDLLEKHTGWTGLSNPETRSAAYFGWKGKRNA